ncbi:hypothetical protein HK096_002815 [Nowakowskiella sp. JEL0078]|nr:hypothetical protein HK096_002815 [Nowakowskiella sp. JEL0078]
MEPIRVGLVGFGASAQTFHLPFILALPDIYRLVSVFIRNPNTIVPNFLDDKLIFSSLSDFLSSPIDLVVITTPPDSKLQLAIASLDAGKHILLEKPMALSSEDAQNILKHADSKGLIVSVYHNRRFDGDFKLIRELCGLDPQAKHLEHLVSGESSTLGKILDFESRFDRFRPAFKSSNSIAWKETGSVPGSGLLYELGSHLIDQALCLFGIPDSIVAIVLSDQRQTVEVAKRIGSEGYIPATDYFHLVLRYGDELIVKLCASNMIRNAEARFIVHGSKGSFIKTGLDSQESTLKSLPSGASAPINSSSFGADTVDKFGRLILDSDGGVEKRIETSRGLWVEFYRQLGTAITNNDQSKIPCSGLEGWLVMKVMEAALESEKTGERIDIKSQIRLLK